MADNPYLPKETAAKLYSTAQSLSGMGPTGPTGPTLSGPTGPLSYAPSSYYTDPTVELQKAAKTDDGVQPVNPVIFGILTESEVNARLKRTFGIAFIAITCVFTLISYAIIILASIYRWQLPSAAFTALVIQAPLQMVGILYIMAKSLYPTATVKLGGDRNG